MDADDPRHGTDAGYQRHRKDSEPACGVCRAARAQTMRDRRKDPIERLKARKISKAGSRAAWRLVDAHRNEYERYYADELAAIQPITTPEWAAS